MVPYIFSGETLTVFLDGKPVTFRKGVRPYNEVSEQVLKGIATPHSIHSLLDEKVVLLHYAGNALQYDEVAGTLTYQGVEIGGGLVERMLYMRAKGYPFNHLLRFLANLTENPAAHSVTELYDFLEANSLPITDDGHFLTYKKVRENYRDIHSGTYDYRPGKVVSMERSQVDDRRHITCSTGLHAAAWEYASMFGSGRIVVLKINPRDVVSVPTDYNAQKMRVCQLEVLSEVPDDNTRIRPYYVEGEEYLTSKKEAEREESQFQDGGDLYDFDVDDALEDDQYFRDGEKVFWITHRPGGLPVRKSGEFIQVIEPGKDIFFTIDRLRAMGRLPEEFSERNLGKKISTIRRALVLVNNVDGKSMKKLFLYSPRLSLLQKGGS